MVDFVSYYGGDCEGGQRGQGESGHSLGGKRGDGLVSDKANVETERSAKI